MAEEAAGSPDDEMHELEAANAIGDAASMLESKAFTYALEHSKEGAVLGLIADATAATARGVALLLRGSITGRADAHQFSMQTGQCM